MAVVFLPNVFKPYTENKERVIIFGETLADVFENLIASYPELEQYIFDENGDLTSFINIYHNENNIRGLQLRKMPIGISDTINIIPAISGG